jgi:hypothetical protein
VRRWAWAWLLFGAGIMLLALTFRPVIEGDGVGYYSYLHAVFVSHSLDFAHEYGAAIASHTPLYMPWVTDRTAAGRLTDYFPVGAAVLSAPAYLVALALHPSGEPQYGTPFVQAFSLASLFYGLAGLAISYGIAARVTMHRRSSLIGVLAGVFATPYFYYLLSDPSYSHTFSVFCVSAFLFAWWIGPPPTYRGWLVLGLLGGLMAMTRFQDGALMALVLIDWRRLRWPALALIPGAVIGFAPQLLVDQVQFGTWLPQRAPGQALNPIAGHYLGILFSSREGLLIWTPAALFAGLGVVFLRDRRLQLACALGFVLEVAVIGSAPDSPGAAFGSRRFLDLIPFAVLGFAALADRIGDQPSWAGAALLSAWNLALVANYEYLLPTGDPGYGRLTIGQLAAVPHIPRLFTKGSVVRDLILWSQAHTTFDPVAGSLTLLLEAAALAAAVAVGWRLWARPPHPGETLGRAR